MKKCSKCGIEKPLSEFNKDKTKKNGVRSQCKVCVKQYRTKNKEYHARYRAENREKIAEYHARYHAENRENILKRQRQYRAENKEKIAEHKAQYYVENREKITQYRTQYYAENRENILKRQRQYRTKNKEKIAEQNSRYRAENKEKIAELNSRYRAQKKAEQPNCVYQIKNLVNNKIYIGETIRGELRWKHHLSYLRGGYHANKLLQEDFDKFGEESFEWTILKEFESEDKDILLLEEARSIQQHINEGVELYNLALTIEQLKMLTENK